MDITKLTIAQARKDLDAGEYTAVELTRSFLKNIGEKNAEINAYLEVFDDTNEQAERADEMIRAGEVKPLTGIPIAIKDNILIRGRKVSAASRILEGYVASYDAYVVAKLRDESAIFLGRTNMDEFAMGSSTEHSAFGPTRNPHDTSRVPGGSSGGSSAAVAAGMALAALGSDTGGSVRQPAALCGVVGMKPTYGAVSRSGLIAMGSSLDQIGPITKTAKDAQVLFDAIRGHDPKDSASLKGNQKLEIQSSKPKIGVPRGFLSHEAVDDVLGMFEKTLEVLRGKGYEIVDIELPHAQYALATYYIIMPAEASTNLARYDGIRYGLSSAGEDLADVYRNTRGEGFGKEVRRRIMMGTFVLSSGYVDAYYRKARDVRALITADFERAFKKVDVVATPTTLDVAFRIGEKKDPLAMYAEDTFAVLANLAGIPAISVPIQGADLPIGFHIMGQHNNDGALFTIGADIEKSL